MNRDRVPYFIAMAILFASSVLLYKNNNNISDLNTDNEQLTRKISEQTLLAQALTDQITQLSETTELLNDSLTATIEAIELENEREMNTFAQVLSVERIIYAYLFEEKINCTFSVNYSFPSLTEAVFLVLDTDQITVLGYEELNLDGTGIATVKVEIPLPETSGKWMIAPSVYWLSDDAPTYSETGWKKEISFDVLDVDPGHSQGTCGEESVKCHGN